MWLIPLYFQKTWVESNGNNDIEILVGHLNNTSAFFQSITDIKKKKITK